MRYIDADALKKDLEENYVFVGFADLLNDIVEVIDAQPAADVVERKTGKWEMKWHDVFKQEVPCCSICHKFTPIKMPYCGLCGADMRGGEDGLD